MLTIERGRGRSRGRACGVSYSGGRSQRNEIRNRVPIAALRDYAFSSSDDSAEQPNVVPNDMPAVDVPLSTNPSVPPCRKRGRGEAKCTKFEKVRKYGKIPLRIKDGETAPCCENALIFTTRITWLVKHYMDLCHASWHDVPANEKEELISRVQDKMATNMSKLEPEKRTKEAAMKIFKEVLGQRSGYVRGLSEMVIPESSRQATDARITELTERAEMYEKEAADYKGQLDDLQENVKLLQAKYNKFIERYKLDRQIQGEI